MLKPGKPSPVPPADRAVGVGVGSTDTTDLIGNTRSGPEGCDSSKGDAMLDEAVEVMVSVRSIGGLLENPNPMVSGFRVPALGEGGSVYVDIDVVRRCGEVGELGWS